MDLRHCSGPVRRTVAGGPQRTITSKVQRTAQRTLALRTCVLRLQAHSVRCYEAVVKLSALNGCGGPIFLDVLEFRKVSRRRLTDYLEKTGIDEFYCALPERHQGID